MRPLATDRQLLVGLLALQANVVEQAQLLVAFDRWARQECKSLGEILVEIDALTPEQKTHFETLAADHARAAPLASMTSLNPTSSVPESPGWSGGTLTPNDIATKTHLSDDQDGVVTSTSMLPDEEGSVPVGGDGMLAGTRFRILRAHASGGLGQVFVARDEELRREVALKEIRPEYAHHQEARERFLVEAEITGGLEHPGIVPVYGLGVYADGRPYYAMRFIRGDSLKEAIRRFHAGDAKAKWEGERLIEFRKLLGRLVDVCNALQYAHDRGVLHRDLKPGNIMLGRYGETLVVDWGLAKTVDRPEIVGSSGEAPLRPSASGSAETVAGQAIGTPQFMSPEQAEGRLDLIGPASDIYSLGATLYTLLTGQPPFAKNIPSEVLKDVRKGDFPRPRDIRSDIAPPLEAICLKAMRKNPADRYESPRAMAEDVENWLADEPVTAWPEPWSVRLRRWAERRRTLLVSSAAVLLVSVVALSIGTVVASNYAWIAKQNEMQAKRRSEQIDQVNGLLENLFRSLNPTTEERERVSHHELIASRLNEAAARLNELSLDDPTAVWRLQEAIASAQIGFGRSQDAIAILETSLMSRKSHLGEKHIETLMTSHLLAEAYWANKQHTKARELLDEALRNFPPDLSQDDQRIVLVQNTLADIYRSHGEWRKALPLLQTTHDKLVKVLGPHARSTLLAKYRLSYGYLSAGQIEKATELALETRDLRKVHLGAEHIDTLFSTTHVGNCYRVAGKAEDAIRLHEETLKVQTLKLGDMHPDTLTTVFHLAQGYRAMNRFSLAIDLLEQNFQKRQTKLGETHIDTLTTGVRLVTVLRAAGREGPAMQILDQVLPKLINHHGESNSSALLAMTEKAKILRRMDQLPLALEYAQKSLRIRKATLEDDHLEISNSMRTVAEIYAAMKKHGEAIEWLEATQARRKTDVRTRTVDMVNDVMLLGRYYRLNKDFLKSRKVLEQAFGDNIQIRSRWHRETLNTHFELLQTEFELDESDALVEKLDHLVTAMTVKLKDFDPYTGAAASYLARRMQSGKTPDPAGAATLLYLAYRTNEVNFGENDGRSTATKKPFDAALARLGVLETSLKKNLAKAKLANNTTNLPSLYLTLAKYQIVMGRFELAKETASECLELSSALNPMQDALARLLLGEAQFGLKEMSAATDLLRACYAMPTERIPEREIQASFRRIQRIADVQGKETDFQPWKKIREDLFEARLRDLPAP